MKKIFIHPLFLVGIGIRLILIFGVHPPAVVDWYAPFLETSISPLQVDPWLAWLDRGGSPAASPYGYAMWIIFLPFTLLCDLLEIPVYLGYASTVLAVDVILLTLLIKLIPGRELFLLSIYWLSPIIMIASYALGLNDLIPVLFLVLSLYFTRQLNFFLVGFFYILAVSAKLSMLLALPFLAVYILHSPALHRFVPSLVKGGCRLRCRWNSFPFF